MAEPDHLWVGVARIMIVGLMRRYTDAQFVILGSMSRYRDAQIVILTSMATYRNAQIVKLALMASSRGSHMAVVGLWVVPEAPPHAILMTEGRITMRITIGDIAFPVISGPRTSYITA